MKRHGPPAGFAVLPPDLAGSFGFLLSKAAEAVRRNFEERIERHRVSARHVGVLSVVVANPSLSQRRIGDLLRVDRTTMVALIDSLEGLGLVTRKRVPTDRRSFEIEATSKGRRVLERALVDAARVESEALSLLPPGERRALCRALEKIAGIRTHAAR